MGVMEQVTQNISVIHQLWMGLQFVLQTFWERLFVLANLPLWPIIVECLLHFLTVWILPRLMTDTNLWPWKTMKLMPSVYNLRLAATLFRVTYYLDVTDTLVIL